MHTDITQSDRFNRAILKRLLRVELIKLSTRTNLLYLTAVTGLIILQVIFLAPMAINRETDMFMAANRYIDNFSLTIIPILFIASASYELDNYITHKFLVSGMPRTHYFFGRMIACGLYSIIAFSLMVVCNIVLSVVHKLPFGPNMLDCLRYLLVALYVCASSMVICLLARRPFYAIIVFILYVMMEGILTNVIIPGYDNLFPYSIAIKIIRDSFSWINSLTLFLYLFIFVFCSHKILQRLDLN